jgi:hypothetical protein
MDDEALKFLKSTSNRRTENSALAVLLNDRRIQAVDGATKLEIVRLLPQQGAFGPQTFDAVMTPKPTEPVTLANLGDHLSTLCLIEMKSTRKPIRDANLNGFFFGATEREYAMAAALGDRYLFAFVVLNSVNEYERPFAVLLTLEQVERRTRAKRIQFQVNFGSGMSEEPFTQVLLGLPIDSGG